MQATLTVLLLALAASAAGAANAADTLERQRAAFREAYAQAELGNWQPAASHRSLLEDYALWPDLRAAWLRARLSSAQDAEVRRFLDRYGALKPARELRYRYATHLASANRWQAYLELYRSGYQDLEIAKLDCLAVHAEILRGNGRRVAGRAARLWLVGHSQADECNPVFDYLRGAGELGESLYRERLELALSAREYRLARYLARSLDAGTLAEAELWLAAHSDPRGFLADEARHPDSDPQRRRAIEAVERLALTDARLADDYWRSMADRRAFSSAQRASMSRHIALWYARQHDPDALERLDALPAAADDDEVRRWRVRAALARQNWPAVQTAIDAMPDAQRELEEWRYWRAMAAQRTGDPQTARAAWGALAGERSYYGFLAADELDSDYAFAHTTSVADADATRRLEEQPALVRARELFHAGLESRGRSEWDDAVASLTQAEKLQASLLAHRWGWHSRAIATLAAAGLFDDLEMRYPLAYAQAFAVHSEAAGIPHSWAYGVARNESLFIPDIRSRAGAVGIMQLMPDTGRRTAVALDLPYDGLPTLTDPSSNIRLGTGYLGEMLRRFGDNRIVATAAYNAGPARVERWLPATEPLDTRVWIENIPFNETRDYVRRVLVSDAIFHWRLTGRPQRLFAGHDSIAPAAERLADNGKRRGTAGCEPDRLPGGRC